MLHQKVIIKKKGERMQKCRECMDKIWEIIHEKCRKFSSGRVYKTFLDILQKIFGHAMISLKTLPEVCGTSL